MLYIPPFWWYSIQYLDDPSTFICSFTYSSLINHVSNIKDLSLYFLQQQNITKKIEKQNELILPRTNADDTKPNEKEIDEQINQSELPVIEEKEKTNETDIKKDEEDVNEIKEPEPITEEKIEEPPKTKKIKTKKQINKEENINYSISDI